MDNSASLSPPLFIPQSHHNYCFNHRVPSSPFYRFERWPDDVAETTSARTLALLGARELAPGRLTELPDGLLRLPSTPSFAFCTLALPLVRLSLPLPAAAAAPTIVPLLAGGAVGPSESSESSSLLNSSDPPLTSNTSLSTLRTTRVRLVCPTPSHPTPTCSPLPDSPARAPRIAFEHAPDALQYSKDQPRHFMYALRIA